MKDRFYRQRRRLYIEQVKNVVFMPDQVKTIKDTLYQDCKLKEQNFYKAHINNCIFLNCDLSESNFSKAQIRNCKFVKCYMQFSGMVRTNIFNCEFIDCDLWHSNLCHSIVHETLFKQCIVRALFKELDWKNNSYDRNTIIESCGGTICGLNEDIITNLINSSKRMVDVVNV